MMVESDAGAELVSWKVRTPVFDSRPVLSALVTMVSSADSIRRRFTSHRPSKMLYGYQNAVTVSSPLAGRERDSSQMPKLNARSLPVYLLDQEKLFLEKYIEH